MATKNNGKEIYYKIYDTLRRKNISTKQMANEIGMSPTNLYDTMKGLLKNKIRYANLIKIANFLEIDLGIRI